MGRFSRIAFFLALTLVCVGPASVVFGQAEQTNDEVLRDFIHYVKINRNDAADLYGRELLSRGLSPQEFVDLLEEAGELGRFEEAVALGQRIPDLESTAASLQSLYEDGKLRRARDPEQITEALRLLEIGRARAVLLARERLAAAGEYAMPQMLEALLTGNPALQGQVQRLMIDMGHQSVAPLSAALAGLNPSQQERVITILGNIPDPWSLAYINDVRSTTDSEPVRRACRLAVSRLGEDDPLRDVAGWYRVLAEGYYSERADLTSFPGEQHQLLWSFESALGLVMIAIDTSVYHEAMAMRAAERSLALRGRNPEALALWVAANLSREIDSPPEYVNPAYAPTRRSAMYFAVASGVDTAQRVLARGIDDRDTPLIRRAIAAIERTAGGSSLWAGPSGRKPLVESLGYPNRRVQTEAALAFGSAQPRQTFDRAERVVPILASAIRDATSRYAVIVSDDQERYQSVRAVLEDEGYSVLPRGGALTDLAEPIAEIPAVDLIITTLGVGGTTEVIDHAQNSPNLTATPVLALMSGQDYTRLGRRFASAKMIAVRPSGISDSELGESIKQLIEDASGGPITIEEANDYAGRSLGVLRDLAVSESAVFDVGDAALPLIGALRSSTGGRKVRVADVLSRINQRRTQVALMDAAINGAGGVRLVMLAQTADSAKRFGNLLTDTQLRTLVDMAQSEDSQEATSAAALLGALNLPNDFLLPLILTD